MKHNGLRPPEPRSGWAKARMRRSQEGVVMSRWLFHVQDRIIPQYVIPLGAPDEV